MFENFKIKLLVWELEGIFSDKSTLRKKLAGWLFFRWVNTEEAKGMFETIREKLSGYKTYIVSGAAILGAVAAWLTGAITPEVAIKTIWEAIATMTLRAAVAKATPQ